ncbi:MAG: peptidase, partial [Armatimonadetes bacterium]|nr:peptidase [Armatimonadota bacterium]
MKSRVWFGRLAATMLVLTTFAASARAAFNIVVNFTSTPTASQAAAFASAEATWESLISGYLTPFAQTNFTSLPISASITPIDGVGGTLGSAGPNTAQSDATYIIARSGSMQFDSADTTGLEANGTFDDVILHEMAHVMGFGTLWELNDVVSAARINGEPTEYIGVNALAAWRTEYGQTGATFVPIEQGGGPGTRGGHWAEVTPNVGGTTDTQGRPLTRELMTGF